jgi:hypothetical protein
VATGDLARDGASEVLGNLSADPTQTALEGARLVRFVDGMPEVVWKDNRATGLKPAHIARQRRGMKITKPEIGDAQAPLRVKRDGQTLQLSRTDAGQVVLEPWRVTTPPAPDFSAVPAMLGPPLPQLLAADVDADGRNELILYREPIARVLKLQDSALAAVAEYTSTSLPVFADLDGDGKLEVVLSLVSPDARPVVEAKTPALGGKTLWRTEFAEPERAGLPQPRKAYVRTGHFTGKPTPDLYVWAGTPVVRSGVLDGFTGELVWEKGEASAERYYGPSVNLASTHDYDGDGNEDLIFTNPDYYCVASGPTGELLLGPLFPPNIFSQPSQGLYTLPAVLEAAVPTVCLVAGHYFQAAMSIRAKPHWYKIPVPGETRCDQEGFMPLGNGEWLMGFGRQNGAFACVNMSDGTVRWELPLEASATDVATCDVDGDEAMEFVFGTSHGKLYAVGDDQGKPRVVWTRDIGAGLGAPIVADLDGDGSCEIAVATADGHVNVMAEAGGGR